MKIHKRELWETRPDSKKLIGKKNCPFCIFDGEEKQYIIFETRYWTIRHNKYPYYGEHKHLMAIPKKHKEHAHLLSKEELKDYKSIELFMKNYYKNEEYFSFIRQTMGNRSIKHLHYHYLVGEVSHRVLEGNNFLKIKN